MGRSKKSRKCPRCSSRDILLQDSFDDGVDLYVCADCDFEFEVGGTRGRRRNDDDNDDVEEPFEGEYAGDGDGDEEWDR